MENAIAELITEAPRLTDSAVEVARIQHRAQIWESAINGVTTVFSILSFTLPLYVVYLAVGALAGKNTGVSRSVAYTVAAMTGGSSALAVVIGGWAKFNGQRKELERLRRRIEALEDRLRKKEARK